MPHWPHLANHYQGHHAYIIGKGASLDTFAAAKFPRQSPHLTIGINHAALLVPNCHFSVSTHWHPHFALMAKSGPHSPCAGTVCSPAPPPSPDSTPSALSSSLPPRHRTTWVCSYPAPTHCSFSYGPQWRLPPWVTHHFLHVHGRDLLSLTRDDIARTHLLHNQSSSAQPAVHFAWYLGCTTLTLIGIDGAGPYSTRLEKAAKRRGIPMPPIQTTPRHTALYAQMRTDTHHAAETLFGPRWSIWGGKV